MAFRAWEGKGLPGEPVREMLIEAVEKRFGAVEAVLAGDLLQSLSDNGGAYIAYETRHIVMSLGFTPVNTPVCSPQSNGMAESFVNTVKRDFVSRFSISSALCDYLSSGPERQGRGSHRNGVEKAKRKAWNQRRPAFRRKSFQPIA